MALQRWEPSQGLASLRQEMDRLFDHFLRGGGRGDVETLGQPAVDVSDTGDAIVVKAQVPGVSKENLQISVSDNTLMLRGEVKEEETKEERHYHRREWRYGAFSRAVPLPAAVQSEQATAQLKDGALTITMPKSEQTKAKAIPIQAAG